jgi:hypothetical protein
MDPAAQSALARAALVGSSAPRLVCQRRRYNVSGNRLSVSRGQCSAPVSLCRDEFTVSASVARSLPRAQGYLGPAPKPREDTGRCSNTNRARNRIWPIQIHLADCALDYASIRRNAFFSVANTSG